MLDDVDDAPPPATLTARIRSEYERESTRRVITKGETVDAGRTAVHRPPLSEYS